MVAEKSRGELGELRSQLMRLSGGGSSPEKIAQKREVFRKVIMLGTIGQDMSSLFMQVRRGCPIIAKFWEVFRIIEGLCGADIGVNSSEFLAPFAGHHLCGIGFTRHRTQEVIVPVHHDVCDGEPGPHAAHHQHAAQGLPGPGSYHPWPCPAQSVLADHLKPDRVSGEGLPVHRCRPTAGFMPDLWPHCIQCRQFT